MENENLYSLNNMTKIKKMCIYLFSMPFEKASKLITEFIASCGDGILLTRYSTKCPQCNCDSVALPVDSILIESHAPRFSGYYVCLYCANIFSDFKYLEPHEEHLKQLGPNKKNADILLLFFASRLDSIKGMPSN